MAVPASIVSRRTVATSLAASMIVGPAGRPPPGAPAAPGVAAAALSAAPSPEPQAAASRISAPAVARSANRRINSGSGSRGCLRRRRRRRRRQRDRAAGRSRQLRSGEIEVEDRAGLVGLRGQECELGIGHIELCAEAPRITKRGEAESFVGFGCVLLARLEQRSCPGVLSAGTGDFDRDSLPLARKLELSQA